MPLPLNERLAALAEEINAIRTRQRELIEAEPVTFKHLESSLARLRTWARERYVVVLADGTITGYSATYTQRPAALRQARGNKFVADTREREVLNHDGEVVHRWGGVPA